MCCMSQIIISLLPDCIRRLHVTRPSPLSSVMLHPWVWIPLDQMCTFFLVSTTPSWWMELLDLLWGLEWCQTQALLPLILLIRTKPLVPWEAFQSWCVSTRSVTSCGWRKHSKFSLGDKCLECWSYRDQCYCRWWEMCNKPKPCCQICECPRQLATTYMLCIHQCLPTTRHFPAILPTSLLLVSTMSQ